MDGSRYRRMVLLAAAIITTAMAPADNLTLYAVNDTLPDRAQLRASSGQKVWTNETGTAVLYKDGDNILVSDSLFTTADWLQVIGRVTPGDVVFDIGETFKISPGSNGSKSGFGLDTKSFTKRGPGTLFLDWSSQNSASEEGGTDYGNAMTCGVDIVKGEIALMTRNHHNYLGPRTVPFWIHIHDGGTLNLLEGNQTGTFSAPECGMKIQLDAGSSLLNITNSSATESCLALHTLKLAGGSFTNGPSAVFTDANRLGGKCSMKIFNALHFSGETPHAFGFSEGLYPGYLHYSRVKNLAGSDSFISLNAIHPIEFLVDNIDGGSGVDAYVSMSMFLWGTNTVGRFKCDIVKTGEGTICFPSNATGGKTFIGDLTVSNGILRVDATELFLKAASLTVSTGAFIGGCGNVTNLTMEAGSGFSAMAAANAFLTVNGDLSFPANGVIDISNPDALDEDSIGKVPVVNVTGNISGAENLEKWKVSIEGVRKSGWKAYLDGSVVRARQSGGLVLILR